MNRRTRSLLRALAPLALMGLIFFLSSQRADEGLEGWEVIVRKFGHVGGYALLTALWVWALRGAVRRPIATAALIAFVYACTDEYHQSFVETRRGTALDVAVDTVGIVLSAAILRARQPRAADGGKAGTRGEVARSSVAR